MIRKFQVITIANAEETLAGDKANFTLTADIEPWQDLAITYTPANTDGAFLDPTPTGADVDRTPEALDFEATGGGDPTATLSVLTRDDPNDDAGIITITLKDDADPKDYTIDTSAVAGTDPVEYNHTATVSVIDVPNPTLSIADIVDPITEGQTITFVITATEDPKRELDVRYTPVDTKGSFLRVTQDEDGNSQGTGVVRTKKSLEFTQANSSAPWIAEITIPTGRDTPTGTDSVDSDHGTITVTLNSSDPAGEYTVSRVPGEADGAATIHDFEIPVITIANAEEVLAGQDATFTLTTNMRFWQAPIIKFTPTNTGGSFLSSAGVDTTGGVTGQERTTNAGLDFLAASEAPDAPLVAPLKIRTLDDPNATFGEITVTLSDDTGVKDYTINTSVVPNTNPPRHYHKATVSVVDTPNPTLSIADIATPIDEGSATSFVVTATEDPKRPLTIAYSITNPKGNYFPIPDDPGTMEVEDTFEGSIIRTFTRADDTSPWTATIPIQTKNPDEIDRDHGTIRVTLNDSNPAGQYTVADSPNHYGEVTVTDDTVPEISINNALDIYEGQKANFTLVADKQPWQAVTIRFKPENTSGEYLLFGSYSTTDIWTEDVTFGPNDDNTLIIGTLPVPTTTATATSGRITVNLHDDDSSPKDYKYSDDSR